MRNLDKRLERIATAIQPQERVWTIFAKHGTPNDEAIRNAGISPGPSDLVVILQTNFSRTIDTEPAPCRT